MNNDEGKMIDHDRYYVITAFRGIEELKKQMSIDHLSADELVHMLVRGSSLLELAIAYRQHDIANFLLDHDSPVNIITHERYNEFHIIAPHLRCDESVAIAGRLLERVVDLSCIDGKYHNTAMFSITLEALRCQTEKNMAFLNQCLDKKQGIFERNKRGFNAVSILDRYEAGQEMLRKRGITPDD